MFGRKFLPEICVKKGQFLRLFVKTILIYSVLHAKSKGVLTVQNLMYSKKAVVYKSAPGGVYKLGSFY